MKGLSSDFPADYRMLDWVFPSSSSEVFSSRNNVICEIRIYVCCPHPDSFFSKFCPRAVGQPGSGSTEMMHFVFCRLYPSSPMPSTSARALHALNLIWFGYIARLHRVATAAFWRTFSDEGKIIPGWWGWGVHAHPLSLHLPSPVKLQCSVRSSWVGRHTNPVSSLGKYVLCARLSPVGRRGIISSLISICLRYT